MLERWWPSTSTWKRFQRTFCRHALALSPSVQTVASSIEGNPREHWHQDFVSPCKSFGRFFTLGRRPLSQAPLLYGRLIASHLSRPALDPRNALPEYAREVITTLPAGLRLQCLPLNSSAENVSSYICAAPDGCILNSQVEAL